jgi:adenylyltransferase/sulfurtransferase
MLDKSLRNRYSRQTIFPAIGDIGQEKLSSTYAVIIGCGALGCNIAVLLARAGVGNLRIIDRDFVEEHNLHRQVLFTEEDVRRQIPKAIAAQRALIKANSTITVEGIVSDVNSMNIESLCHHADIILDGLDNLETRYLVNDVAMKHRIPWVYGGALGSSGMTMTIIPGKTACLRCAVPFRPERADTPTCESAGVINTAPAIIGVLQANEALKIIVGTGELNTGLLMIDLWSGSFDRMKITPRENCPTHQGRYDFLKEKFTIKATPLCGQTRAIQVVDSSVREINLFKLADHLKGVGKICIDEQTLTLSIGEYQIVVFPDGRAIIKNTIDEIEAKALFAKYVAKPSKDMTLLND